ncbi:hypothetical protein CEP54_011390 [Fusarium duplospermum]|uniref:Uncharacterized protein n=1 Tax=Fusarium duplospermum TaxID=1325734 RepID=A0A428PES3_9HYPO|nr:hypothetical protein CEP54_011390 [Fusarium duplospermum]
MSSPPAASGDRYFEDDYPQAPDGSEWNGLNLLDLLKRNQSPFNPIWDVNLLLQEVEEKLGAKVTDVPRVYTRVENYDFDLTLSDQRRVLARLSNADVNMPNYGGYSLDSFHNQLDFEVAIYGLLQNAPDIPTGRILHFRYPLQHTGVKRETPKDINGRWLMILEMPQGERRLWPELDQGQKSKVGIPREPPFPISSTRDFWVAIFETKIESMIGDEGEKTACETGETSITSVFGWEAGAIVPLVLSEVKFMNGEFVLTIDDDGEPAACPLSRRFSRPEEWDKNRKYAAEVLKKKPPAMPNTPGIFGRS